MALGLWNHLEKHLEKLLDQAKPPLFTVASDVASARSCIRIQARGLESCNKGSTDLMGATSKRMESSIRAALPASDDALADAHTPHQAVVPCVERKEGGHAKHLQGPQSLARNGES